MWTMSFWSALPKAVYNKKDGVIRATPCLQMTEVPIKSQAFQVFGTSQCQHTHTHTETECVTGWVLGCSSTKQKLKLTAYILNCNILFVRWTSAPCSTPISILMKQLSWLPNLLINLASYWLLKRIVVHHIAELSTNALLLRPRPGLLGIKRI